MIPFLQNQKVWGFLYLKIEKLPPFHLMFFDRYEIRIQAFGDVFMENVSFVDPHLHKIILRSRYSKFIYINSFKQKPKEYYPKRK